MASVSEQKWSTFYKKFEPNIKLDKLLKINYHQITRNFKHKLLGLSRSGIGGKRERQKY